MKYINDSHRFDSEECVNEIIEVIKNYEVPFVIMDKMLEEVKEKITSSIIIKE